MVRFLAGASDFCDSYQPQHVQTGYGVHRASSSVIPNGVSPGVMRPKHETDYPPPSNAEVKNYLSFPFVPPMYVHGVHVT